MLVSKQEGRQAGGQGAEGGQGEHVRQVPGNSGDHQSSAQMCLVVYLVSIL